MLEWSAYVDHLLTSECGFDGLDLSFDNDNQAVGIPPIIKASVLMLDRMLERQGKINILVFPERVQSIFIFTLVKLLHNIAEGRIERDYDPEKFSSGEHLRLGRAIVEFVCVTETPKGKGIKIKLSDIPHRKTKQSVNKAYHSSETTSGSFSGITAPRVVNREKKSSSSIVSGVYSIPQFAIFRLSIV